MRITPATLCFLLFSTLLSAQHFEGPAASQIVSGAETIYFSKRTDAVSYIKFRPEQSVSFETLMQKKQDWMPSYKAAVDFEKISEFKDELGITHRRMQLRIGTIPVEGAHIILHERNGKLEAINGDLFRVNAIPETPKINQADALQLAKAHIGAQTYMWEVPGADDYLKLETNDSKASFLPVPSLVFAPRDGKYTKDNFTLAWKLDVYAYAPMSRRWIFIDAKTGAFLYEIDRIHTADVVGSASTMYSGTRTITADQTAPNNYRLRETGRGGGIQTLNCLTGTTYGSAVDFTDTDNFWNNANAALDQAAGDAHAGTEATWDYYHNTHNWNSYDNNNSPLLSYIHYGQNYGNAFWDGSRMTYGDGGGGTLVSPTTSFDICGHEVTHGVTEFTAGLIYADESGALNESFSDIFGTVIENYSRPGNWNWLIGEDASSGNGIRNMANPPQFNDPDCYGGPLWIPGADVHYNSGVQNKWFYFLTQGGSGTNPIGNPYNVTALGMTKAAKIAFRNLSVYLTPSSEYSDARFFAIQSASDLYGACSTEMIATANAWYAVGVGGIWSSVPQAQFVAAPLSACNAPVTVQFTNSSNSSTSFIWYFGDGGSSTQVNPSHTYTSLGTYNVRLIATGCNGARDTLIQNNYITIDTSIACAYSIPSNGSLLINTCSGNILDPGGLSNYPDNSNSIVTISPPNATTVRLDFNSFDLESGWDFLNVYDGPSTMSPQIGSYTGSTLPNGGIINSSGGSITLEFTSDGSITRPGFDIDFECTAVNAPPVADFSASPFLVCDGTVQFNNTAINGISYIWDFGDGMTSNATAPSHTYSVPGSYSVRLIACNNFGCDTIFRPYYVIYDPQATNCTANVLPGSGTHSYSACRGTLLDDGGTSNYSNGVNTVAVISAPGASQVSVVFSIFELEQGYDYLRIYNGPNTLSPLISTHTGSTLPANGLPITSSGGAMTIEFSTDVSVTLQGFELEWSILGAPSSPTALFSGPTTSSVGQIVNFTDLSSNASYWSWDFGDGTGSSAQNGSHVYSSPGTYLVSLRATNTEGCDDTYSAQITIGTGVGVDEQNGILMQVWPNPARSSVNVVLQSDASQLQMLRIRNSLGQEVFWQDLHSRDQFEGNIDVKELSSGLYFVIVETDSGKLIRKLIID